MQTLKEQKQNAHMNKSKENRLRESETKGTFAGGWKGVG